jgi:hypothetical protein
MAVLNFYTNMETMGLRCLYAFISPTVGCREGFIARAAYVWQQGHIRLVYGHYSFPRCTLRDIILSRVAARQGWCLTALYLLHFCWVLRIVELTPEGHIIDKLTRIDDALTTRCKQVSIVKCSKGCWQQFVHYINVMLGIVLHLMCIWYT